MGLNRTVSAPPSGRFLRALFRVLDDAGDLAGTAAIGIMGSNSGMRFLRQLGGLSCELSRYASDLVDRHKDSGGFPSGLWAGCIAAAVGVRLLMLWVWRFARCGGGSV